MNDNLAPVEAAVLELAKRISALEGDDRMLATAVRDSTQNLWQRMGELTEQVRALQALVINITLQMGLGPADGLPPGDEYLDDLFVGAVARDRRDDE